MFCILILSSIWISQGLSGLVSPTASVNAFLYSLEPPIVRRSSTGGISFAASFFWSCPSNTIEFHNCNHTESLRVDTSRSTISCFPNLVKSQTMLRSYKLSLPQTFGEIICWYKSSSTRWRICAPFASRCIRRVVMFKAEKSLRFI